MEQTSAGFLVLILDTNPSHWWRNGDGMPANQSDLSFQKTVESVLIFVSSYLLLNRSNRLIFLAAHAGSSVTLYPDALSESESGDQIGLIRNIVLKKLLALSEQTHDSTLKSTTSISGSISRGLCCKNSHILIPIPCMNTYSLYRHESSSERECRSLPAYFCHSEIPRRPGALYIDHEQHFLGTKEECGNRRVHLVPGTLSFHAAGDVFNWWNLL